jgi:hypothetical protein
MQACVSSCCSLRTPSGRLPCTCRLAATKVSRHSPVTHTFTKWRIVLTDPARAREPFGSNVPTSSLVTVSWGRSHPRLHRAHSLAKRFGSRAVCSAAARSPRESSGCRKSRVSRVGFLAFCRTGRTNGQLRHCGTVTCVCREPPCPDNGVIQVRCRHGWRLSGVYRGQRCTGGLLFRVVSTWLAAGVSTSQLRLAPQCLVG